MTEREREWKENKRKTEKEVKMDGEGNERNPRKEAKDRSQGRRERSK